MPITINGSTGITFPAGGQANTAGSAVGTTDIQTLTNKTLTGATMSNPTISSGLLTFPDATTQSTANTGIGYGQTWQSVSRLVATTYTNSTGKPIMVAPWFILPLNSSAAIIVAGIQAAYLTTGGAAGNNTQMNALVPAGATYSFSVTGSGSLNSCAELR